MEKPRDRRNFKYFISKNGTPRNYRVTEFALQEEDVLQEDPLYFNKKEFKKPIQSAWHHHEVSSNYSFIQKTIC